MKIKRQKKVKKIMLYYQRNCGFYQPYNLLIDGTFCQMALKEQIGIQEQLPKYLESELNIVTTQCIIMEVENLLKVFKNLYGGWMIVKQFHVHQCGHKNKLLSATGCVKSLLKRKNPNRYIVATMDRDLQNYIRTKVVGAPLLYLHGNCPTLESPSPFSKEKLLTQTGVSEKYEIKSLKTMKKKVLGKGQQKFHLKRKRKPNPNPRSLIKKKPQPQPVANPHSRKGRKKYKEEDVQTAIKKVFSQLENVS